MFDITADLVEELTTTTGTGNLTLAGASGVGLRTFNSAIITATGSASSLNFRVPYSIGQDDQAEWEVGIGYLSGITTFVRETVFSSSNSGALVSFSAGSKRVRITVISTWMNEHVGQMLALGSSM
jgi:hypothetical protein